MRAPSGRPACGSPLSTWPLLLFLTGTLSFRDRALIGMLYGLGSAIGFYNGSLWADQQGRQHVLRAVMITLVLSVPLEYPKALVLNGKCAEATRWMKIIRSVYPPSRFDRIGSDRKKMADLADVQRPCNLAHRPGSHPVNLRFRATAIHLAGSACVASVAWWLVSVVWYPEPLAALAGGSALFAILVAVDVVIGPALTAVVADPRKGRRELVRDLSVILLLQLSAFAYGMYSMAAARPVALAFEIDLFRVVTAAEVNTQTLSQAPASLRSLSWTGPVTLASVKPTNPAEQLRTIDLGFAGVPLAALPEYWREYAPLAATAWAVSKPVAALLGSRVVAAADIERIAAKAGVAQSELRGIPLLARRAEGMVILAAPDARVVAILALAAAF